MGHVVDEVVFYLRQLLLAKDDLKGKDKNTDDNQGEQKGRKYEFRGCL